jgi:CDP-diacylglycerol--glycerol-3-phosphate 3-phosphatidyltransferase
MNLPNKLTTARFLLTAAFVLVMFAPIRYNETISLVLFCLASISDFLDGLIARRRQLITNFGILMDPLADKIMVCSAFIAFVGRGWMDAWMVIIIVARELAITGLRLLAASKQVVLAAERFGKH